MTDGGERVEADCSSIRLLPAPKSPPKTTHCKHSCWSLGLIRPIRSPCPALVLSLIWRMEFSINQIKRDEVQELLELIRELARFEKLEHEVEATVESLTDSFFEGTPVAGALIGRVDGELA